MLIGIDGIPLAFPKTGVGHYTFELSQALARMLPEHRFELLYPSSFPQITDAIPARDNLTLNRVPVGPVGRHWWSAGLPRHFRRERPDLFHGTNYDIPLWRPCPTVLTIHDLSLLLYPETHEKRSVSRARRRLPVMASKADTVIVPTNAMRQEVIEYLGVDETRVVVVYEAAREFFRPVDSGTTVETRQRLGIGNEFILNVGTIEPRKNISVLVSAFEDLVRSMPGSPLQLVIVGGRGWLSSPVLATIEKSPVRNRIVLTGYLHDEELRDLYSSCRLFVYPSLYEGFGLPPLEAMACGAPVIVSTAKALVEVGGNAAQYFEANDPVELTKAMIELLANDDLRSRLSESAKERAAEFSWTKAAIITYEVYRRTIEKTSNYS